MKLAPCSGKNWIQDKQYKCRKNWPDDCFVQAGERGLVLGKKPSYSTAFFEALPKNPNTFVRGEGKTVAKAERSAWDQFQKFLQCSSHEFERRGYQNVAGFCRHCDLFNSKAFDPSTKCVRCDKPTYYSDDVQGNWWCSGCATHKLVDKRTAMEKFFQKLERRESERESWQESVQDGKQIQ